MKRSFNKDRVSILQRRRSLTRDAIQGERNDGWVFFSMNTSKAVSKWNARQQGDSKVAINVTVCRRFTRFAECYQKMELELGLYIWIFIRTNSAAAQIQSVQ